MLLSILELYVAYRHNVDLAVISVPEESAVDTYKQQDANELVIVLVRARHLGKRGTPPDEGPLSRVRITSGSWAPTTSTEKRGISPLWLETFRIECEDFEGRIKFEVLENDDQQLGWQLAKQRRAPLGVSLRARHWQNCTHPC